MNRLLFSLFCLFSSSGVFALGLGELKKQPVLGERLQIEINITGSIKEAQQASCYKLKQPSSGDDIPWVKSASLTLRPGPQPVLEIRSSQMVHDPILAVSIHVACGQEIVRDYMLLASPARENRLSSDSPVAPSDPAVSGRQPEFAVAEPVMVSPKRAPAVRRLPPRSEMETLASKPASQRRGQPVEGQKIQGMADRLTLSAGGEVGEPTLRISSELASLSQRTPELSETQREVLRLEFRMLLALQEQALTQLAASEKLRNLDKGLLDLQKGAADLEKKDVPPAAPVVASATVVAPVPAAAPPTRVEESLLEEWGMYIFLALAFSGIAAWLGWKEYRERRVRLSADDDFPREPAVLGDYRPASVVPAAAVAPELPQTVAPVDVDPVFHHGAVPPVRLNLDEAEEMPVEATMTDLYFERHPLAATTVDEGFEANPVMELADIMLSFGRVKGAAQALQEYIDANPQEALQPWMRLLEVYRMAGMRAEFEELALNLNKNFNVEIQHWDLPVPATGSDGDIDFVLDAEVAPAKAEHLEEMPRIMQQIIEHWPEDTAGTFIYELLRDNRGGARLGFSLGVVEEMVFLIELKETAVRMDRESKENKSGG